MGCGSSQLVAAEQNAVRNGDVKRESPPPQQPQQQPEQIRQESPPLKRSDSAKSKSSSSSSSSRSSSAKSKKSRPETAPGGNTPAEVELNPVKNNDDTPQTENTQNTEAPESNNNKDSENSAAVEETEKVEETPDETTTQGAVVSTEEGNQGESQEHEKPNFSEDVLKEFVEVENQVNSLEQKGAENAHQVKHARLVELHKKIGENHGKVEQLKAQTAKEYQDVVDLSSALNVRSLFVSQDQLNAEFEKEKKEYVDALNKQEIAEQELESMKQHYKKLYDEVIAAKKDQDELNSLRKKEEELLGRIFNDSYGSDKEWKLEMELDMLGERKERIKGAHVRWKAAHVYLDYAAKQLSWSTRRWAQIASHRVTVLVVKYQMVAETRNHLIAAIQNIKSAHDHLRPINIPYCTKDDVEALQAVTNTIFNDVNIPQNYQKSYNLFASMFSKSSTLLQWVGRVVDEKISTDLAEVKKEFHEKYYELKEERMNLIKTKVKEKLGVELELEVKKDDLADEDSSADEADIAKPGEVAKEEGDDQAPEPEDKEGVPTEAPPAAEGEAPAKEGQPPGEAEAGADSSDAASKPVALSELAPPPTQEDLFGNIDQIKKQHEEELAEFEKAQELNKARVEQGLQEKLRARRSRRRKIQAQEEETNALSGEGSSNEPPPPSEMGL